MIGHDQATGRRQSSKAGNRRLHTSATILRHGGADDRGNSKRRNG
jgi:hypothetical protein